MNDLGHIWGTYRRVEDYAQVFDTMRRGNLAGIDTAPNYQNGLAERELARIGAGDGTAIFGKVGYTSGDADFLKAMGHGRRHCLDPAYIDARVKASSMAVFPVGGKFESVMLHNPEHLWEGVDEAAGDARIAEALFALASLVKEGVAASFGIATWTLSPYSGRAQRAFANLKRAGAASDFRYFMHPVSILRRELLLVEKRPFPNDVRIIASAPLAGGEAMKLLGPVFSAYFGGVADPLAQSLMLAQANARRACIGVGSVEHARQLQDSAKLPSMQPRDLRSLLALLDTI